jgi:chromosome segregation ATPase
MKWIGWVFAVALLVIFIVVQHGAHKRLADARADVDAAVAEETAKVDAVFERAEEGIPARRERLAAETAKTTDLETRLASLSKSTDQLREAKGTLTDTQQENLEQIRELQEQLAKLETQSQLLERALLMVTEKKDF